MKNHNFYEILDELKALHDKKNLDYGHDYDPYANVRGSQEWGVEPWKGTMIRLNDKIKRLQKYAKDGKLANEGVEDSLMDIGVYAIIALDLWRQEHPKMEEIEPGKINYVRNFTPEESDAIERILANHNDPVDKEWR